MKNIQKLFFFIYVLCPALSFTSDLELPVPEGVESELILQYPKEPSESFSEAEAIKLCQENQARSRLKYFETVCLYNRQEVLEEQFGYTYLPKWKYLGTEVTESRDLWWNYYSRIEKPILKKVEIRKWEAQSTIKKQRLSISIYGVGLLKDLPWRELYSTQSISEEYGVNLGTKRANAKWNCENILSERHSSLVDSPYYIGARCKTYRVKEGVVETVDDTQNWFFKIETQNPFI